MNIEIQNHQEVRAKVHPCFSTLNHNLAYCYDTARAIQWVLKQASRAFQGVRGSFED